MSLVEVSKLIKKGEVSPLTVVVELLKKIREDKTNSFITCTEELALQMAEKSAYRIRNGEVPLLEGVPIGVKDLFCTKGVLTTAASKILDNFIPTYESTVTRKLWENGAIMIGKTNMDEFAMGSSNQNSFFGKCKNPWDLTCVPGGSSGGSAAAVANYLCYAALGSDTGGSVRQPASFCGVVGFKPSYGRCSRFGMVAYSSSLDQAGVLARSVEDACLVMDCIVGQCDLDSTTSSEQWIQLSGIGPDCKKNIGYFVEDLDLVEPEVKEIFLNIVKLLRQNGANITEIKSQDIDQELNSGENLSKKWLAAYYTLTPVEAFSNLSRYDGIRYGSYVKSDTLDEYYKSTRSQFGNEVKRRIMLGGHILLNETRKHYYKNSIDFINFVRVQFSKLFKRVDLIISPTSPHTAFKMDAKMQPERMYAEDLFTIQANILRSPAISIPAGLIRGMPIGIHMFAEQFQEKTLIEVSKFIEKIVEFKGLGS